MTHTNAFGLNRTIPEAVKRAVRQRCFFGCVICGAAVVEYEHFAPDFREAREHCEEGIVLLCPNHHAEVTKGLRPKEQLQQYIAAPAASQIGFAKNEHPTFRGIPSLIFGGGAAIHNTPIPLQVAGTNVLEFEAPEAGSEVAQISAHIRDIEGNDLLELVKNEWRVSKGVWDFECTGQRYIFRNSRRSVVLQLRLQPPHRIVVELLRTRAGHTSIEVTPEYMMFGGNRFSDCVVSGCEVGFSIG